MNPQKKGLTYIYIYVFYLTANTIFFLTFSDDSTIRHPKAQKQLEVFVTFSRPRPVMLREWLPDGKIWFKNPRIFLRRALSHVWDRQAGFAVNTEKSGWLPKNLSRGFD